MKSKFPDISQINQFSRIFRVHRWQSRFLWRFRMIKKSWWSFEHTSTQTCKTKVDLRRITTTHLTIFPIINHFLLLDFKIKLTEPMTDECPMSKPQFRINFPNSMTERDRDRSSCDVSVLIDLSWRHRGKRLCFWREGVNWANLNNRTVILVMARVILNNITYIVYILYK